MPSVDINGTPYPTYASADEADAFLAGDVALADGWAELTDVAKARGLVTATRILGSLPNWCAAPDPAVGDLPLGLAGATSLLAALILADPALADDPSSGSNVKAVRAGTTGVDFFRPVEGAPLPLRVWTLLRPLLSNGCGGDDYPGSLYGYAGGTDVCSRLDPARQRVVEAYD